MEELEFSLKCLVAHLYGHGVTFTYQTFGPECLITVSMGDVLVYDCPTQTWYVKSARPRLVS